MRPAVAPQFISLLFAVYLTWIKFGAVFIVIRFSKNQMFHPMITGAKNKIKSHLDKWISKRVHTLIVCLFVWGIVSLYILHDRIYHYTDYSAHWWGSWEHKSAGWSSKVTCPQHKVNGERERERAFVQIYIYIFTTPWHLKRRKSYSFLSKSSVTLSL